MMRMNHSRPTPAGSGARRGSAAGSIALLVLFAAVLVAASYPWLALAVAAGAVGARVARRAVRAFRRRRSRTVRTREAAAGSDVPTPSPE